MLDVKINCSHEQNTSTWSSGTKTQLAIYPESALYSERNFLWRISTAVVDAEESVFTSLPGYERLLMVLEGRLELQHEYHHSKTLKPLEIDAFSGHWKTIGHGQARDFNLMFTPSCLGTLTGFVVNHWLTVDFDKLELGSDTERKHITTSFYIFKGGLQLNVSQQNSSYQLMQGDFIALTSTYPEQIPAIVLINAANEDTVIIQATVIY
jgi:uncharacterized protein